MMDLTKVATFKNIDDKTFVHHLNGRRFEFKPSESVVLPYDAARHFAKHLVRKIKITTSLETKDQVLLSREDEGELISKILGGVYVSDTKPKLTQDELLAQRIAELNPPKDEKEPVKNDKVPEEAPEDGETKAVIIARMVAAGLSPDKRKSLANLRQELASHLAVGSMA